MIAVGTLFLLGTTLVSGSVIRDSYPYPPAIISGEYGLPIKISDRGAYISVVYDKCEHGNEIISAPPTLPELAPLKPIVVEEPKEPIIIPEAPQLGPFVIPEYLQPSIELAPYPAASIELAHDEQNCNHILPSAPDSWPAIPIEIETSKLPLVIPEAPQLGPFTLPEFPVRVEVPESAVLTPYPAATYVPEAGTLIEIEAQKEPFVIPEAPVLEPLVLPEATPVIIEESKAPVLIPEAPELGPLILPEFPIRIEVPEAPVVITEKEEILNFPVRVEAPEESVIIEEPKAPIIIPEAPELGPLVLPEFPVRVEAPEAPIIIEEPKAPFIIPEAPVLRPFTFPEFPVRIEVPEAPVLIAEKEACKHSEAIEIPAPATVITEEQKAPIIIPEAPLLGPLVLPEFPARVPVIPAAPEQPALEVFETNDISYTNEIPALAPVIIPEAPVLPPLVLPEFPTNVITEVIPKVPEPCVHNIVQPALLDESYLQLAIPAAPELPPLKPYIPTVEANFIPGPPAITYGLPQ